MLRPSSHERRQIAALASIAERHRKGRWPACSAQYSGWFARPDRGNAVDERRTSQPTGDRRRHRRSLAWRYHHHLESSLIDWGRCGQAAPDVFSASCRPRVTRFSSRSTPGRRMMRSGGQDVSICFTTFEGLRPKAQDSQRDRLAHRSHGTIRHPPFGRSPGFCFSSLTPMPRRAPFHSETLLRRSTCDAG